VIIGLAGHIDHGKSALVEALTGRTMDPLAEERRRGITLDLHFCPLELPDGRTAGVVDVPGHEDLVRTMVAGASGVDLVLLVVAADEGVMPQTREHLAVVEQLGIPAGIPVITKVDKVAPDWLEMVETEVARWLHASRVGFAAPVLTSAETGQGLADLRRSIAEVAARHPGSRARREVDDLARLPVDRAFAVAGAGTVVTGTTWSGAFRVGDAVMVLPDGHRARVRSLERHGREVPQTAPGERIAVALAGVEVGKVRRGQTLVHAGAPWAVSRAVDVRLEVLGTAPKALTHQTRVRVHLGTLEVMARLKPLQAIEPGSAGLARLVLEEPAVARGGDRLVLRSFSPVAVIGGGWVVDPLPPPGRPEWPEGLASHAEADRLAALLARRPRGLAEEQVPLLLGTSPGRCEAALASVAAQRVGGSIVLRARVLEASQVAWEVVRGYQRAHPSEPGMPRETHRQTMASWGPAGEAATAELVSQGTLVLEGAVIREPGFHATTPGGVAAMDQVVQAVTEAGLAPPSAAELATALRLPMAEDVLRLAAREGRIVLVERDRYYSREALDGFGAALAQVAARGPITPAAVREVTGLSRKYLIPLLEWADRNGLTVRRGEAREPGPRLAVEPRG